MDSINGLSHIMKSLRRQFSDNVARSNKSESSQRSGGTIRSTRPRKKISVQQLEKRITERIQLLDNQSSDYNRQATHVFIESVIVWEFGEHILNDAKFPDMTRAILNIFDGDDNVRQKMQAIINKMR